VRDGAVVIADSAEIAGLGRHCVADGRRNRDVVGVQVVVDVAVEVMGDRDVGEGHVDAARHARGGVLLADTTASPSSSRGPVTTQQPSSRRSSVPSGGTTFISWRAHSSSGHSSSAGRKRSSGHAWALNTHLPPNQPNQTAKIEL